MKNPMLSAALVLLANAATADGVSSVPSDPEVVAPRDAWSGPYVGLSYGRVSETSETVQCFKLGEPKACDDPIFIYYPEFKEERRTVTETSDDVAGVIAGYRFDLGRVVVGAELGISMTLCCPASIWASTWATCCPTHTTIGMGLLWASRHVCLPG